MKKIFVLFAMFFLFTDMCAFADESFNEIKLDKSKIYTPTKHRIISGNDEEEELYKVDKAKQEIQYQGEDYMYRQNQQMNQPMNPMFMNPFGALGTMRY